MNEHIKVGADIHDGNKGYEIGTQEEYDSFVKVRNQSLAQARIKELAGQALDQTVPDTWTTLTAYDLNKFTEVFAELIVKECLNICEANGDKGLDGHYCADEIVRTFRS